MKTNNILLKSFITFIVIFIAVCLIAIVIKAVSNPQNISFGLI